MSVENNLVYLLLGSNLGDVQQHLLQALKLLQQRAGFVKMLSPVYRSEAWGFKSEGFFLNQVVALETPMQPRQLLEEVLAIEKLMGRKRKGNGYQSRIIDIDILFFNDQIIHSETLTIPHPRLHLRNFTLRPLNDIAPAWVHPVMGKSISELLQLCSDPLHAQPIL